MKPRFSKKIAILLLLAAAVAAVYGLSRPGRRIDFNTEVKPIINNKCIACHGGVKQQAGFSLLFREEALQKTKSGKYGIVPGSAGKSEMISRIKESDPEERMPYKHEPLTKKEISILTSWVNQGAEWGTHWAYLPVEEQEIPGVKSNWIKNDIDRFVLSKLDEEKLSPSTEADKATLLRRVSLDLTGLPPTDSAAQRFLNGKTADAYEQLVDDLLASAAYGEKWTAMWMDLARYGDTKGYESDGPRTIWRYRDWVIDAFNKDKPYNEFLIEQLAGDVMPGADDNKYIATAFHRNTMTNDEGGTDNEEFRTAAVMDRVNTTWSALMGTTFNCVQCHSHPYDPFKHEEYYKFLAFFNNTRDEDTQADYPLLRIYRGADSTKFLKLDNWLRQNAANETGNWYRGFLKTLQPAVNSLQCDEYQQGVLFQNLYAGLDKGGSCRLPGITLQNKSQLIFRYLNSKSDGRLQISLDSLNGRPLLTLPLENTKSQWKIQMAAIPETAGKRHLYFKFSSAAAKDDLPLLLDWLAFAPAFPGDAALKNQFIELLMAQPETMPVMVESNPEQFRSTHIFERGNWLVKGAPVNPGVPQIMNPMPAGAPANRLGLALWLTDKKNPLTARTMVNRLWEQLFGTGLAETLEDMGTQGTPPVYLELLDYLSWKLMYVYNWSIKKLLREIVTSATYRQSSAVTPELLQKDPNNNLLARFSRVRLSGEQLRDQALAISGLLSKKMYGPGVMPFQPSGVWLSPYNPLKWELSPGEDQYRRALYTYWKRTAPYPSLVNFDGVSREVCVTRRIRTNTPLQALNGLNDSAFFVMARQLALNMRKQGGATAAGQIQWAYQHLFYKRVAGNGITALERLYSKALAEYKKNTTAAAAMMGEKEKAAGPEDAAMTVVANALLNLDEWVNKN